MNFSPFRCVLSWLLLMLCGMLPLAAQAADQKPTARSEKNRVARYELMLNKASNTCKNLLKEYNRHIDLDFGPRTQVFPTNTLGLAHLQLPPSGNVPNGKPFRRKK